MLGGPPQLKPGHGRRVCSAARSRWILGLCLSGRGRRKGPRLARADVPMCSPRTAPCLRRGTVPPSGRGLRGNACSSGQPCFGFKGNVPSTHHCSAKGPVVRLGAHNNRRRARAPSGVTRESPRAATPQHRKTSARAQPSRRGAPRRAAERRTGLVIRNLGAGWYYKLPAVLCYIPLGKPAAGRRYSHPARQPRQLQTREAAAHGTMPSRRTPPEARGGFAAPAGQLNATAWGSPKRRERRRNAAFPRRF